MKMLKILAVAIPLAACGTTGGLQTAQKTETTGYSGFTALSKIAVANHRSGALSDEQFQLARQYLDEAKRYLDLAYTATSVTEINADTAKANASLAKAAPLVGVK